MSDKTNLDKWQLHSFGTPVPCADCGETFNSVFAASQEDAAAGRGLCAEDYGKAADLTNEVNTSSAGTVQAPESPNKTPTINRPVEPSFIDEPDDEEPQG